MWIVRLALRRPYTFIVLAIVITLLGVFAISRTPTDIFPNIKIPVVATIWRYTGLSPEEMATRLVLQSERTAQTTVNDVEHTESQITQRHLGGEVLLPAERQRGAGLRADHRRIADPAALRRRRAPPRRSSSPTTPPRCRSCSWRSRATRCPRRSCSTSATTSSAPGWPPCRAPPCPTPTAACSARCRWTWTRTRCAPRACRATTSPTPSTPRTLILPAGTQKIGDREYFVTRQRQPARRSPSSTTCRSRPATAASSTCATWRTCATATRRRPTSCAATATAAC